MQSAESAARAILTKLRGDTAVVKAGMSLEWTLGQILDLIVPVQYGGISVVDGSTAQTVEGAAEKVVNWVTAAPSAGGVISDPANGKVTVGTAGVYLVSFQCSWMTGLGAAGWVLHARVNGVESGLSCQRRVGAPGGPGSASAMLPLRLPANADIDIYVEHDAGVDRELTLAAAQLSVVRVGS